LPAIAAGVPAPTNTGAALKESGLSRITEIQLESLGSAAPGGGGL
jgi:hypothetical protein